MSPNVEVMIVDNNACNDKCFDGIGFVISSRSLKVLEVGDYSFSFVE